MGVLVSRASKPSLHQQEHDGRCRAAPTAELVVQDECGVLESAPHADVEKLGNIVELDRLARCTDRRQK
jgi:hypothetical protein